MKGKKYVTGIRFLDSLRQKYQNKENFEEVFSRVEKLVLALPLSVVTQMDYCVSLLGNRRILLVVLNLEYYSIQCDTEKYTVVDMLDDYYEYHEPEQELIDILSGKKVPNKEWDDEETEDGD